MSSTADTSWLPPITECAFSASTRQSGASSRVALLLLCDDHGCDAAIGCTHPRPVRLKQCAQRPIGGGRRPLGRSSGAARKCFADYAEDATVNTKDSGTSIVCRESMKLADRSEVSIADDADAFLAASRPYLRLLMRQIKRYFDQPEDCRSGLMPVPRPTNEIEQLVFEAVFAEIRQVGCGRSDEDGS